ncbi:MAG: hypothetical protein QM817_41165 [Archangium sp.]
MKRLLTAWLVACLTACAPIETNTRVERGPLLRTFERPVLLQGGLTSDVRVEWPMLKLTVVSYDVCRAQSVEEYAEDHITERTSRAVGPSLSTGIANVLASAVLFGVSFALSSAPNTSIIDRGGYYGASTQQIVRGVSLTTIFIGVPALAVGLFTKLQTGDEVVTERAEQVVSQKDARCNERPSTGPMTLIDAKGGTVTMQTVDGALDIDGTKVPMTPETLRFAEREVELTEDGLAKFAAWSACVSLVQDTKAVDALSETGLLARAEKLRMCRAVRGEAIAPTIAATDAELTRRRANGSPAAWAPGTNVSSFEEAVSAYAPKLKLAVNSKDLSVLDAPEAAEGRAVLIEGIVASGVTENIGVVQIGDREVFLFIPPRRAWTQSFPNGSRIEAVALISGRQAVGEKNLPLLRAVWMRAAW